MDWGKDMGSEGGGVSDNVGGVSGKLDNCGECCSLKCKSVEKNTKRHKLWIQNLLHKIFFVNYEST